MELKRWEDLTIGDNFLFQKVMRNPEICKHLLEKILGFKIKKITYPQLEKTFSVGWLNKGIRLDVYIEDESGTIYDVEMQTTNDPDLAKRARYYQSIVDVNAMLKGKDYIKLNRSFIIFICTFDLFKAGRFMYTFRNICVEDGNIELGDESTKIFLNAKGTDGEVDDDVKNFLAYINGQPPVGDFMERVAAEVEHIKMHDEMKVEYMAFGAEIMRATRNGETRGEAKGRTEERIELIRNFFSDGTPLDKIARCTGYTEEQILEIVNSSEKETSDSNIVKVFD